MDTLLLILFAVSIVVNLLLIVVVHEFTNNPPQPDLLEPGAPVVWPPADWVPPREAARTSITGSHIAQINTIHDEEE